MSEWQPIETAPKDGSEILVWDGTMTVASWQGIIGWQTQAGGVDPSAWMPLPPPPIPANSL